MNSPCNVCNHAPIEQVYASAGDQSITSLAQVYPGPTKVFFCDQCGHLQTAPLPDLEAYYEDQYRILIDSVDEDQLYRIDNGHKVFRVQHQVDTLLSKIDLPKEARVLDFGCAKGATSRLLLQARPDIAAHLFDVSNMYEPFWQRFVSEDPCATHQWPNHWAGSFDVVMSYFVIEHVVKPVDILIAQASLLKPGGVIYFIVPNVYTNSADLVVADHVNHFSKQSLSELLNRANLHIDHIDASAHDSAWVVTATKTPPTKQSISDVDTLCAKVQQMSLFWSELADRVHQFEAAHNGNTQSTHHQIHRRRQRRNTRPIHHYQQRRVAYP
jgi:SAM-dependent methyltransferase